jgi:hypothetical protein
VCDVGEHDCDGPDLYVCNAAQDDWDYVDTCVTTGLCDAAQGTCDDPVCDPGNTTCVGNEVHECNAARTGFAFDHACTGTNVECDPLIENCLGPVLNFGTCTAGGDRWMHHTENSFNIQGWVYDVTDATSDVSSVSTCDMTLRATAFADEWSVQGDWGAEVGIRLCEEINGGTIHNLSTCPLPGDQDAVAGVRFTLCAGQGSYPAELRVIFPENNGPGAYRVIPSPQLGVTYTVYMTDADVGVWWDDGRPSNPSQVTAIGFNMPALNTDHSYSLCITNIEILGTL